MLLPSPSLAHFLAGLSHNRVPQIPPRAFTVPTLLASFAKAVFKMCFLNRPRKPTAWSQSTQKRRERGLQRSGKPPHTHPQTFPFSHFFSPRLQKMSPASSAAPEILSQIFWLGICEPNSPEAWKASLMSVTVNTGWSSRPAEDVALQVVSYSFSTVNNC